MPRKYERIYDHHHVYPKQCRHGRTEKKIVKAREHNAWHQVVGDKDPANALCYVIMNFMPSEYQYLLGIIKGRKNLPDPLSYS